MERKFATISDTFLGLDNGVLKFYIQIYFDDYCSGFGGTLTSRKGAACVAQILDTVGVKKWEHLKGHQIQVYDNGFGSVVLGIWRRDGTAWLNLEEFRMPIKKYKKEKK